MYLHRAVQILQNFFQRGYVFVILLVLLIAFLIYVIKKHDSVVWTGYYATATSLLALFVMLQFGTSSQLLQLANVATGLTILLMTISVMIHFLQYKKKWAALYACEASFIILMPLLSPIFGMGIVVLLLPIGLCLIGTIIIQRKLTCT
jgi:hypothetical protein